MLSRLLLLLFVSALWTPDQLCAAPPKAATPRARFVGPFRFDLIDPDECKTRADGFTFSGALEVAALPDTSALCWSCSWEGARGRELPICCRCSIWHEAQCLENPRSGRHDFRFDFCRPSARAFEGGVIHLKLLRKGGAVAAETTVAAPSYSPERFATPRHPILAIRDQGSRREP